jgi:hypothetical protein
MNGIRLISGSSAGAWAEVHGPLRSSALLICAAVQVAHEALGGQLQRQQVGVHPGPEIAPEDQRRNGHDQAERGVVQRHRNAVRQLRRVAAGGARRWATWEPKISIMPITVPSRPSSGAAEAMVASALRYFSSRWATGRPAPSMVARRSASLQRGLLLRARSRWPAPHPAPSSAPAASPRRAWARHCATRTGLVQQLRGRDAWLVFRLMKRSMMSASARMEQAIRGQMGQPAACMMESNSVSARM